MTPPPPLSGELARLLAHLDDACPLKAVRETLAQGHAHLGSEFDAGRDIEVLVAEHAAFMDGVLCHLWQRHMPEGAPAALVAVGGYGRGELHPASDIDLLVLLSAPPDAALADRLEGFVTLLWDLNLEVGHSVRTLDDCVREAARDITVITNLMEARRLAGPPSLFQALNQAIAPTRIWPSDAFFQAKWEEQQARWHKYGDTAYNLEPNIKENPGGLRDIQMIGWVTRRHFGTRTLHELVERRFLTEAEFAQLMDGRRLLWRIRYALHRLAGRREDRLLFDYQRTLAERFGYRDDARELGVEQFMQRYYRTVMELNRLNEMLLQLFQEAIVLKCHLDPPEAINARFQSRSGFLEIIHEDCFQTSPVAVLEAFHLLQTRPGLKGLRAGTIRRIRESLSLVNPDLYQDLRATSLFMEILRHGRGVTHALRRMNRYGVLAAYIPAFGHIVGRMQYDLFHVYTVDEHTLRVVRNLRRFFVPEHRGEFPLCSAIAGRLPKPELLILAGLFHDIAKGRGGDHSRLGAKDAWAFCREHHLSYYDAGLVSWLVEHHLVMSMTAQRRDIADPDEIRAFADLVSDSNRLDYLYLLTVADSRATDPKRWTSWRDALLRELYENTRRHLTLGAQRPPSQQELVEEKRREALRLLAEQGIAEDRCIALWIGFSYDFFVYNAPSEIAWQTQVVLDTPDAALPRAVLSPDTSRGSTLVFLYSRDQDDLFARAAAALDQLGLDIQDARILTTDDGKALNLYLVLDAEGKPLVDPRARHAVEATLALSGEEAGPVKQVTRRQPRARRHFHTRTQVHISQDEHNQRTLLRLVAGDRPGLLADVGQVFSDCGVRLHKAKIATIGAAVEDVFFLSDREDRPVTGPEQIRCLTEGLQRHLDPKSA